MNQFFKYNQTRVFTIKGLLVLGLIGFTYSSVSIADTELVDTFIVTGEKIDKNIKDVATAVTLIGEETLESGEHKEVKKIAVLAPNVIADQFNNISIRGITGGGAATGGLAYLTGARSRISTVVDGTTQDFSGYNFSPVSAWDVEKIEVLRGPQSTSQGSTAIGGALVVNTKDPTFYSEQAIRAGMEHYENGNVKYNLAAMSSGTLIEDELAYRIVVDSAKGEGWLNYDTSGYDTPNLNESKSVNTRAKLLWEPKSIPELSAKLTLNYADNQGEHANFASADTDDGTETKTYTLNGTNEVRLQDSNASAIGADIDYQINDTISNSLHLSLTTSDIHDDAYSTGYEYDIDNETYSLENRILFSSSKLKPTGVVGFYASKKDAFLSTTNFDITTDYQTITSAIYGEATYPISGDFRVVTGLRVENESSEKSSSTAYSGGTSDQTNDETHYLPKLSLMHDLTKSTTIALTASQGYSPSGVAISFFGEEYSYDSEEVTAFELSSKSIFHGKNTLNANIFYNDYDAYQAGTSSFTIVNVDKSVTYGMEVEGAFWVNDNLQLRSSLGLLDSDIKEDSDYEGNELTNTANINFSTGFTVNMDEWSFGADATYVSEYYSDLDNDTDYVAGDYILVDARVSYLLGDVTVDAYVKNLTDESAVYYQGGVLAAVSQSRTVGLSLSYRM